MEKILSGHSSVDDDKIFADWCAALAAASSNATYSVEVGRIQDNVRKQQTWVYLVGPGPNSKHFRYKKLVKRLLESDGFVVIESQEKDPTILKNSPFDMAIASDICLVLATSVGSAGQAIDLAMCRGRDALRGKLRIFIPCEYSDSYVTNSLKFVHQAPVEDDVTFSITEMEKYSASLAEGIVSTARKFSRVIFLEQRSQSHKDIPFTPKDLAADASYNVLMVSSSPRDEPPVHADIEYQALDDGLSVHDNGKKFGRHNLVGPDIEKFKRSLRILKPDIVHFSGHIDKQVGVLLCGKERRRRPVDAATLSQILEVSSSVKLVVLAACHSADFAGPIAETGKCVIAIEGEMPSDDAPSLFSHTFYEALAQNPPLSVQMAVELAKDRLKRNGYMDLAPRIKVFTRADADPNQIVFPVSS